MLNDPLETSRKPNSEETYPEYRNGLVTTRTFEKGNIHICYGVNETGYVFDYCYINRKDGIYFIDEGAANEDVLARARKDLEKLSSLR